jgi:hypothetical protein
MHLIPNGFRDRSISLCTYKNVDKKEILRIVSNTGIYYPNENICYSLRKIILLENSSFNISALCNSCEDMACCSSVQCTVYFTVK